MFNFLKPKGAKLEEEKDSNLVLSFELLPDDNINLNLYVPNIDYENLSNEDLSRIISTYAIFLYSVSGLGLVTTVVMKQLEKKMPKHISDIIIDEWVQLAAYYEAQKNIIGDEEEPLIRPSEVFKQ